MRNFDISDTFASHFFHFLKREGERDRESTHTITLSHKKEEIKIVCMCDWRTPPPLGPTVSSDTVVMNICRRRLELPVQERTRPLVKETD